MSRPSGKQFAALFVLILLTGYGIGFLGRHYQLPPYRTLQRLTRWAEDRSPLGTGTHPANGQWFQARPRTRALPAEAMERLAALGYVGGYEPPPELVGVTRHDPASAFRGLNLYASGHGPEALLVDMEGGEVHRWRYSFVEAFPGRQATDNDTWWRRVHAYPNGDLLAIFDGLGLIRIDRHSNLKWARAGGFHHDAFVGEDGTIYVLYGEGKVIERFHEREPLVEEFILALDSQGNTRSRISLLEAFERSDYAPLLRNMPEFGDIFHTNTLDILEAPEPGSPIFERGQALISVRNLHVIATVDLESQKVVWARTGMWAFQHQPVVLSNGNLMVFDNIGGGDFSKVIEIDPVSQRIEWIYRGSPENGFFSATLGSCQRLPNGNTLITESEAGRAFEVTSDHRIVWEFYNPERAGENDELIATLFEVVRLPPDFGAEWLQAGP